MRKGQVLTRSILTTTRRQPGATVDVFEGRSVTRVTQTVVFDVFSRVWKAISGGTLKSVKTMNSTAADISALITLDRGTR